MSYFRDATKRPGNVMPDHGWQDPSEYRSQDLHARDLTDSLRHMHTTDSAGALSMRKAYEGSMTQTHEAYVHLSRSMLIRLNIQRSNGDTTPVLCVSQEVKHSGLRMRLPCRLDLAPGAVLDMEMFTLFRETPVAVKGIVQNVLRTVGEDVVRYMVEVRFKTLSPAAEHEINAFIHAAQLEERRMMLA